MKISVMSRRPSKEGGLFRVRELTFQVDTSQAKSWGEFHAMCYRLYRESARAADELFDEAPVNFPVPI